MSGGALRRALRAGNRHERRAAASRLVRLLRAEQRTAALREAGVKSSAPAMRATRRAAFRALNGYARGPK